GPDGEPRGVIPLPPGAGTPESLAAAGCAIWLVTCREGGALELWQASRTEPVFKPATLADLASLPRTNLVAFSAAGLCPGGPGPGAVPVVHCFDFRGCPVDPGKVAPPQPPGLAKTGDLVTLPIDSGIARCRWHRVRIDADLPLGTSLKL